MKAPQVAVINKGKVLLHPFMPFSPGTPVKKYGLLAIVCVAITASGLLFIHTPVCLRLVEYKLLS